MPPVESPARILVRLPNWLGDVLLARPLLHALRGSFPSAEILAVAPAPLLELLAGERVFARGEAWPEDAGARRRLAATLRAFAPEVALVLPPSFSSALLAWRAGARRRIGYAHELRSPLLTDPLRRPARGDRHLSAEYLELGARLGARPRPLPELDAPAPAAARLHDLLRARGLAQARLVLLGPGAVYGPAKRWAAARFIELGRTLVARGFTALACGVTAEREVCAQVAAAIGPGAASVAGETSLAVQAALCAHAAVAVCNDSGLAHLAAATGTPTVVVFGSTSSAWTAPLGPRVRIVQHAPVCAPCFQRTCRIGTVCLEAVTVAEVRRAVLELAA